MSFVQRLVASLLGLLSLGLVLGAAGAASAQATSVSVLGLTSLEGDDEFARNMTGALRHAASGVTGWTVSDRDVALSQMELTHDCSSSDASCMAQIAATLTSERVIYGTIQRAPIGTRYEFQITLYLFNAASGEIEERTTHNVPSSDTDIDALRDPAREMVRALSASITPGTIRVTGTPDLEVRIDDEVVGRTDSTGSYVSDPVAPGPHTVRLGDASAQDVRVAGNEVTAEFAVTTTEGGGGGGGSVLPWIGIGLLGVAAVSAGVWIYSMARIDAINSSGPYAQFREEVGRMPGVTASTNVCDSMYTMGDGVAEFGRSACSEGGTLEIVQYVFLATAIVSAGAGIGLIAAGASEGSSSSDDTASLRLRLSPSASPTHAYLGATLEF